MKNTLEKIPRLESRPRDLFRFACGQPDALVRMIISTMVEEEEGEDADERDDVDDGDDEEGDDEDDEEEDDDVGLHAT